MNREGRAELVGAALVFALAVGAAGCGTRIVYTPIKEPPHPISKKAPGEVEVVTTQVPSRPYVEVGLLEARQESANSLDNESAVLAKLREEAGERGCDAILVTGSADEVVGSATANAGTVSTLKGYKATCLMWTGEPAKNDAPPAVAAADAPPRCVPGESRACVGPAGCQGGQACSADGASYAPCDCGGSPKAAD